MKFYGALTAERLEDPDVHGFFVAIPRLTAEGDEKARQITSRDNKVKVLAAHDIVAALRDQRLIIDPPDTIGPATDHAVVVTEDGIYRSAIQLDPQSRTGSRILVWSTTPPIPSRVLDLISSTSNYGDGLPSVDASVQPGEPPAKSAFHPVADTVIASVAGSKSDFEYQLPASPKYFVGRSRLLAELEKVIADGGGVVVLNAQSGWGKSSLALRLKALVAQQGLGRAVVVDARTATNRTYVTAVLRHAALEARADGILELPDDAAWATLSSAMRTLSRSNWQSGRHLVVFFDQFENVFKDPDLTREFRDLALGTHEIGTGLTVGFAWKTDLVGWTEGHPYQLRDEIRAHANVITLDPLGPREVETLLRRLEKALDQRLLPDLRQRLREYSQGLPWLLKKLAGHLIREARGGATQEQLLADALNIQSLFEADLAELQPIERDALLYIARFAPVAASEVTERVQAHVVQSLLDRRLIVQVGARLDTYWDTFRDFLNTGRVPVEDSYILRLGPRSVGRLLRALPPDGNGSVPEIAAIWGTSDRAVFNVSRELRLLGVTAYEPNRVRVVEDIWSAADREHAIRQRVIRSLRRHRAYTRLLQMAERGGGRVSVAAYARELQSVFPAVSASRRVWPDYARVFSQWFEYAGLAAVVGQVIEAVPDGDGGGELKLLEARSVVRIARSFPQRPPGPALKTLIAMASEKESPVTGRRAEEAVRDLATLGALAITEDGTPVVTGGIIEDGRVSVRRLRELLAALPGCAEALSLLTKDPAAEPAAVGELIAAAYGAEWSLSTMVSTGKHMRAWARYAGVPTQIKRKNH